MSIMTKVQNPLFDEGWERTFRGDSSSSSKYKAVWEPHSKNEKFWEEVLIGKKIVDIKFDNTRLCAFKLDSGEVVNLVRNEKNECVIAIQD